MAKESMVTRTIVTTQATVLCLDIDSGEACNRTFLIPRTPKNEKEILKFASKLLADEPSVRPVHVVDTEQLTKRYGMTESNFIAIANEL